MEVRYWLLLSPASWTSPPGTSPPLMSIGGQPLSLTETAWIPICVRQSKRSASGLSCIRSSPSKRTFPGASVEKVVRNRMAVPALPIKISSSGAQSFPPFPETIKAPSSSRTGTPKAFKAWIMYFVSSLTNGFSNRHSPSVSPAISNARLV